MANQTETPDRNFIAKAILISSFIIIAITLIYCIVSNVNGKTLFNLIWPLITTWVGTILAFYFGKENFEAASKSYKEFIDKLSPDVLDDATVRQVMTDRESIVTLDLKEISDGAYDVKKLAEFLSLVKKSRLPILDNEAIKYVIHKSLLTDELALGDKAVTAFDAFVEKHKDQIIKFGIVREEDKIEVAQKLIKENNESDIFVVDSNKKVKGWLTNTQIARYLTC